jgi:hypothetical protein
MAWDWEERVARRGRNRLTSHAVFARFKRAGCFLLSAEKFIGFPGTPRLIGGDRPISLLNSWASAPASLRLSARLRPSVGLLWFSSHQGMKDDMGIRSLEDAAT